MGGLFGVAAILGRWGKRIEVEGDGERGFTCIMWFRMDVKLKEGR